MAPAAGRAVGSVVLAARRKHAAGAVMLGPGVAVGRLLQLPHDA